MFLPRGWSFVRSEQVRNSSSKGLDFRPHILVVPVGTAVEFHNSDTPQMTSAATAAGSLRCSGPSPALRHRVGVRSAAANL